MTEVFLLEILSQPQVLRSVLDRYLRDDTLLHPVRELSYRETYDLVLLTGMGSSYFALYPTCIYLNERGVPTLMLETSELLHYYPNLVTDRTLLVVVSQSGETVEARRLLKQVAHHAFVLSLTNSAESYVARHSDLTLLLYAGREEGPSSKSYTVSLAVLLLCAMALTSSLDDQKTQGLYAATRAMEHVLDQRRESIDSLAGFLGRLDTLSLLGRGPSVASAAAGSLVLKEVAKIKAEAMTCGQFRHGPLEVAAPGFVAVIFAPDGKTKDLNLGLAQDIARFGGKVVLIGSGAERQQERIFHLSLPPLEELLAPLVEIVPLQLLSRKMALDRGLQPGTFSQAGKVTLSE